MKESMNCLLNKYFNLEMTEIVFDKTISVKKSCIDYFYWFEKLNFAFL